MPGVQRDKRVAVVGGGLVGSLQACFLAKRGYNVDVYEMRSDIRQQKVVLGRSINLALSRRGRDALRYVGLEDEVIRNGIPMYARMIHDVNGRRRPIPYGVTKDQYIMSVDRRRLNELLITAAERYSNVQLHFEHKLSSYDLDKRQLVFERPTGESVTTTADVVFGCDGAYSAVRAQMMKSARINYSQEYIPHGYIELRIPPTQDHKFAMETNYLHIWPREQFMLIALPDVRDNSFVLTLFMPFVIFDALKTDSDVLAFFEDKFPDALKLIGRESLLDTFARLQPLPLVSVKCNPYHIDDRVVMLGDAAHAMVPFFGQGLNCGFEDLLVFEDCMNQFHDNFAEVLPSFTVERCVDAQTINDLAMNNYIEMRSHVNRRSFLLRKALDKLLNTLLPSTWVPLYTMVAFTRTRYQECLSSRQWQDKVLRGVAMVMAGTAAVTTVSATAYLMTSCGDVTWSYVNNMASKMAAFAGRWQTSVE